LGAGGLLKTTIMKKLFFLLALLSVVATSCTTLTVGNLTPNPSPKARGETPPLSEGDGGRLYLTGNDEPAASSNYGTPPMYFTGNDEPAAYGLLLMNNEQ
jgi:hypothetical protein